MSHLADNPPTRGSAARSRLRALAPVQRVPARLFLLGCAAFFAFVSFFLLVVALPLYLEHDLGLEKAEVGTVIGATYLMNFIAYVFVGSRSDRSGAGRYIVSSALALAVAAPLFGVFTDVWGLAAVALLQGVTMSAFVVAATTFAGQVTDPERRGAQMGVFGLFTNAAAALSPAFGVAIYHSAGPSTLFAAASAAGVIAAGVGGVAATGYPKPGEGPAVSLVMWLREAQALAGPATAVVAMGVPFGVILAFMPGQLSSNGVENPGLFYTAEIVSQLLLRTAAGSLSDTYGRAPIAGAGLLALAGSVVALVGVTNNVTTVLAGMLAGAGFAAFAPVLLAWMFDRTPRDRRGLATATYLTGQDAGRVIGTIGISPFASFAGFVPFAFGGIAAAAGGVVLIATGNRMRASRRQAVRSSASRD